MSDCVNGGRRAYNAPTHTPAEDRLEITVHFHGEFNPHPIVLNRLDREVDYVTVDGERFERVRECEYVYDGKWFACSVCGEQLGYLGMSVSTGKHGEVIREALHKDKVFCPYCGARVKEVGE